MRIVRDTGGDKCSTSTAFQYPEWHRDAACIEHPGVEFFPERHERTKRLLQGRVTGADVLRWGPHAVRGARLEREREQDREHDAARWAAICAELGIDGRVSLEPLNLSEGASRPAGKGGP